jgi:2-C-methyl-D-erythritol 4-phosphate cytidylyltransferase
MKFKYKLAGALVGTLKRMRPKRFFLSCVILAAGSGTRMGADKTKQWLTLDGEPVVVRSLKAFDRCRAVKEIILCVKADELELYSGIDKKYGIKKLKTAVVGGATRAESASIGFKRISDKATHVAFHDAARCLITPEMIRRVASAAITYGAAAAACKATDTVKICSENETVRETPDRSNVWLAQTPQIFETEIYRASTYVAIRDKITVTDDCSLAENAGFTVKMVDCGKENLKITEPLDLCFAEAVLKKRKEDGQVEK